MTNYSLNSIPQITIKYTNNNGKNKNVHFNCVENYHFYIDNTEKNFGFTFFAADNNFWNGFRKDLMNSEVKSFVVSAKGTRIDSKGNEENYWQLKNEPFNKCSVSYCGEEDALVRVNCHSCNECNCDDD